MKLELKDTSHEISKSFMNLPIKSEQFRIFKDEFRTFANRLNDRESEENQKNVLSDFLKNAFYRNISEMNTKGKADLVIHNSNSGDSTVGVLIEVKKSSNKSEMISPTKPNAKALHESLLYYMRERYLNSNKELKHIIITNIHEWYIFDANEFEKYFFNNKKLIAQFKEWKDGLYGLDNTDWFYNEIAKPFIEENLEKLTATYFHIDDYFKYLDDTSKEAEAKLTELFRVLSPINLLKQYFANDSNTLNYNFYGELLHILGLEENSSGAKKLISRLPEAKRNPGSLLENTIRILEVRSKLDSVPNLKEFGDNAEEQLFSVSLELVITWLNRILFIKLLEGQLFNYYGKDYKQKFLNINKIGDYDELNEVFFEIFAVPIAERDAEINNRYGHLPYLNSSLFEETALEKQTINISDLKDRFALPIYSASVLKNAQDWNNATEMPTQRYLFDFLDAYNFASDSSVDMQEDKKQVINAAVLGLVFEKINGYKDGSFFTPGYITMYMCRESIRRTVLHKFNTEFNWHCETFDDIKNHLSMNVADIRKYNAVINAIKLCDPAVGSGHFLVSALNEIIAIKSELGILADESGKRLKEYKLFIDNDEIIILNEDGKYFEYLHPSIATGAAGDEMQRVQRTLFHEKQTIIENCLFGVDINPKSVAICRLRLWIELLKNMYFKMTDSHKGELTPDPKGENFKLKVETPSPKGENFKFKAELPQWELEVLPNIDINIKTGNSLISRFAIDDNAKISRGDAKVIPLYKKAVGKYKTVTDKTEKKKIVEEINNYRRMLKGLAAETSTKRLELSETKQKLDALINQTDLFAASKSKKEEKEFAKQVETLNKKIATLQAEVDDIEKNPIYANAFEWRFEFPEVLNDDGDFVGFDVVIGNPPYISSKEIINKDIFKSFTTAKEQFDLYSLFIELSTLLLQHDGTNSLIVPDSFLARSSFMSIRKYLCDNTSLYKIVHLDQVFTEASVSSCIYFIDSKEKTSDNPIEYIKSANAKDWQEGIIATKRINYLMDEYINSYRLLFIDKTEFELIRKIYGHEPIANICVLWRGEELGKASDLISTTKSDTMIRIIQGNNINRYELKGEEFYIDKSNIKKDNNKYEKNKIVVRQLGNKINATMSEFGEITLQSVYCLYATNKSFSNKFILAVLNSTLIDFLYQHLFAEKQTFPRILLENLKKINIPMPTKLVSKQIIKLVDIILAKKEKGEDTTIEENKIDELVYRLYNLTDEEIKIIDPEFKLTGEEYNNFKMEE